jgi:hypothetical protein
MIARLGLLSPQEAKGLERFKLDRIAVRHSGTRAQARGPGIHNPDSDYGFRARRFAAPRND